jgi:hypothetical protein
MRSEDICVDGSSSPALPQVFSAHGVATSVFPPTFDRGRAVVRSVGAGASTAALFGALDARRRSASLSFVGRGLGGLYFARSLAPATNVFLLCR